MRSRLDKFIATLAVIMLILVSLIAGYNLVLDSSDSLSASEKQDMENKVELMIKILDVGAVVALGLVVIVILERIAKR